MSGISSVETRVIDGSRPALAARGGAAARRSAAVAIEDPLGVKLLGDMGYE